MCSTVISFWGSVIVSPKSASLDVLSPGTSPLEGFALLGLHGFHLSSGLQMSLCQGLLGFNSNDSETSVYYQAAGLLSVLSQLRPTPLPLRPPPRGSPLSLPSPLWSGSCLSDSCFLSTPAPAAISLFLNYRRCQKKQKKTKLLA